MILTNLSESRSEAENIKQQVTVTTTDTLNTEKERNNFKAISAKVDKLKEAIEKVPPATKKFIVGANKAIVEEKKQLLLNHRIALYDAVSSCAVDNSADASIHAVVPADLSGIFQTAAIQAVFANGNKAHEVCTKQIGISAVKLPSTSPANARFRFDDLLAAWKAIRAYL